MKSNSVKYHRCPKCLRIQAYQRKQTKDYYCRACKNVFDRTFFLVKGVKIGFARFLVLVANKLEPRSKEVKEEKLPRKLTTDEFLDIVHKGVDRQIVSEKKKFDKIIDRTVKEQVDKHKEANKRSKKSK